MSSALETRIVFLCRLYGPYGPRQGISPNGVRDIIGALYVDGQGGALVNDALGTIASRVSSLLRTRACMKAYRSGESWSFDVLRHAFAEVLRTRLPDQSWLDISSELQASHDGALLDAEAPPGTTPRKRKRADTSASAKKSTAAWNAEASRQEVRRLQRQLGYWKSECEILRQKAAEAKRAEALRAKTSRGGAT